MTKQEVRLIAPTETLREAYMDFLAEFEQAGEKEVHGAGGQARADFAKFVGRLLDHAHGRNLPDGWVPCSTYWLVRGRRITGTCGLRHKLTEALRDFGGHIGYSVRPSERNKGYATLMLKLVLIKARELKIPRALVTCDKDNIASARVIEKNGGVLDSESYCEQAGRVTQRYWIELNDPENGNGR